QSWEPRDDRDGGGQSTAGRPELLPSGPDTARAGSQATFFGLMSLGLTGGITRSADVQNSDAVVSRAGRRRIRKLETPVVGECTGDIAHLEAPLHSFAFCSPCQVLSFFTPSVAHGLRISFE